MAYKNIVFLLLFVLALQASEIVGVSVQVQVKKDKPNPTPPLVLTDTKVLNSPPSQIPPNLKVGKLIGDSPYQNYIPSVTEPGFYTLPVEAQLTLNQDKQVVGIIVSIHNLASYDSLFSSIKQESKEGTTVLTYLTTASEEKVLLEALNGNLTNANQKIRTLVGEIDKLTPNCSSCIVFNWECSSGYSNQQFPNRGQETFGLVELIIKRGYLAMFSDFSLKALIKNWKAQLLGPNPFVKVGQTNTAIQLKFHKDRLLSSPSSQLQAVAHLAASDQLSVNVLGGTIMYAVDSRVEPRQIYQLEVLTVASNFPAPFPYLESKIDRYVGLAGHVLLSYKSGGKILTSMGHWIQLMKINTTQEKLFETAEKLYGTAEAAKVKAQYQLLSTPMEKLQYQSAKSVSYVQNQSPGVNNALKSQIKS